MDCVCNTSNAKRKER